MLTAILRSNTILGFLLSYALSGLVLVLPYFLIVTNASITDFLFAHWAFGWLQETMPFIPILCMLVISLSAIIARIRVRETKEVLGNRNLMMVIFTCLIMAQPKVALARPDVLVSSLIIIGLFLIVFSTYKRDAVLSEMFHVGLMLGLSSLFVGRSIFLLLAVIFSLLMIRTSNWKEWAVLILGLVMTGVFVMMFTVWNESPFLAFLQIIQSAWASGLGSNKLVAGHWALLPAIFVGIAGLMGGLTAGTVTERNTLLVNVGWISGILLMSFLLGLGWKNGLILVAFPLSSSIAKSLESIKRWWIADLVLLMVLSAPFLSSLWQL